MLAVSPSIRFELAGVPDLVNGGVKRGGEEVPELLKGALLTPISLV